jgi:alkylation response protein AidB-like acyl-CoA dehydrogenase
MRFALSEDQAALREGVRELLAGECSPAVVRAAWAGTADAEPGRVTGLWRQLVELGIAGAAVPEDAGGLGLGACDVVPLLEETGWAAVPLPVVETAFVAAPLLARADPEGGLLARVVAGETLVACALDGCTVVPWGGAADLVLVSEDARGGRPIHGLEAAGATEAVSAIDGARVTRRLRSDAGAGERLAGDPADVTAAWWRGVLGCSAQLVGLARRLLELTAGYVAERRQFGVPVGSFQAIKHHLANALIAVEFAGPAVRRAAWSMDRDPPAMARDVAMAKALASEAAEQVAGVALQCHGAIAYTTEYDLHLFAKRAWASARTWGTAESHRALIARELGLDGGHERQERT